MQEFWRRKFSGLASESLARKLDSLKETLANSVEEKSRKLKITLGT